MNTLKKIIARNQNPNDNPPILIAFLGDSVTHGCFEVFFNNTGNIDTKFRPDKGYVAQFQRVLNSLYPCAAVSILNAGVSGNKATDGAKRLERDVLIHRPDLVVVCFGLNDSGLREDGIPLYQNALKQILECILQNGIECILLTPNRMCSYVSPEFTDDRIKKVAADIADIQNSGILDQYVETARQVAAELNIPVADAYEKWTLLEKKGVDTTEMLSNRINHPSEESCNILVHSLLETLMKQ